VGDRPECYGSASPANSVKSAQFALNTPVDLEISTSVEQCFTFGLETSPLPVT
jgi:hypothetical protein